MINFKNLGSIIVKEGSELDQQMTQCQHILPSEAQLIARQGLMLVHLDGVVG